MTESRTRGARAALAEEMRALVAEQLRSGQTVQAFSEERGIPYGRLRYWRLKLRREGAVESPQQARPVQLAEVQVAGPAVAPGSCELVLPHGLVLRIPAGHDAAEVARLVQALVGSC